MESAFEIYGYKVIRPDSPLAFDRCENGESKTFCGKDCRFFILGTCKDYLRVAVKMITKEATK